MGRGCFRHIECLNFFYRVSCRFFPPKHILHRDVFLPWLLVLYYNTYSHTFICNLSTFPIQSASTKSRNRTESRDKFVRHCHITTHADLLLPQTKFQIVGYLAWAVSENLERFVDMLLESPPSGTWASRSISNTRVFGDGKGDPIRTDL